MVEEQSYLIDTDLGTRGGRIRLKNHERFTSWIEKEYAVWAWLITRGDSGPIGNISTHLKQLFNHLRSIANSVQNAHLTPQQANNELRQMFASDPPSYFYSQGETGQAILAIRETSGDENAALAYSLLAGAVAFNPRQPKHFQLLMQASMPSLLSGETRRSAARASYRGLVSDLEELSQKHVDELRRFQAAAEGSIASATEKAARQFRRGLHFYAIARRRGRRKAQQSIDSIHATEKAFAEQMRLKSAVSYWDKKRENHNTEEANRSKILLDFVKASAGIGSIIYFLLFRVMLEMSGVNSLPWVDLTPTGNTPLPATSFAVIAITLGAMLTGLIWAARILVRNYQTERHLKIDAEERRVMTMTYLALINEGKAIAD